MMRGICIFVEHWKGEISTSVSELVTIALKLKERVEEPIQLMMAGKDCAKLLEQLEFLPVDEIFLSELEDDYQFQDDVLAVIYEQMLKEINPSCLLIPASDIGRSLFPRVASRLKAGMTADCTELEAVKSENGRFLLRQIKPSFEENVKVCIYCKENASLQMATVREGVYEPCDRLADKNHAKVCSLKVEMPPCSNITMIEELKKSEEESSIQAADVVVVGGKGVLAEGKFECLTRYAEKIGAAVGGTRPVIDEGKIPFEHQIGQTGCTIRPKICLSFGVSGAIQHTEGIKNTDLFIAVNTAEDAPIFSVADYGAVADAETILNYLLEI